MKMRVFLSVLCIFALTSAVMAQPRVYLVGGNGTADNWRNRVFIDILGAGLTFFDADNNEITMPGLGYQVTWVNAAGDEDPAVGATFDAVIALEAVNSGDVGSYIARPVPYLAIEQVLAAGRADRAGGVWFTPAAGVFLPAGDFLFRIDDNTHPITSLYSVGQELEVTFNIGTAQLSGIDPAMLASGAKRLATTGLIVGPERVFLAVMEAGTRGFAGNADAPLPAGSEPAPARRAFLGYHEFVHMFDWTFDDPSNIAITPDGVVFFQRVVQWLVGAKVTADGTAAGAVFVPGTGSSVGEWSVY